MGSEAPQTAPRCAVPVPRGRCEHHLGDCHHSRRQRLQCPAGHLAASRRFACVADLVLLSRGVARGSASADASRALWCDSRCGPPALVALNSFGLFWLVLGSVWRWGRHALTTAESCPAALLTATGG